MSALLLTSFGESSGTACQDSVAVPPFWNFILWMFETPLSASAVPANIDMPSATATRPFAVFFNMDFPPSRCPLRRELTRDELARGHRQPARGMRRHTACREEW